MFWEPKTGPEDWLLLSGALRTAFQETLEVPCGKSEFSILPCWGDHVEISTLPSAEPGPPAISAKAQLIVSSHKGWTSLPIN